MLHDDVEYSDERILRVQEQELVRGILSDRISREILFDEIDYPYGPFRDSVPDGEFPESVGRRGGDIDFVGLLGGFPSRAICIEFKKVKVKVFEDGSEKVNKLAALEQLIWQGNERRGQGFHKTYICAVAVIDSHERKTPNVLTRGASGEEIQQFYNLDCLGGIHPDVGIVLAEIVQPTGRSYKDMWGFGACLLRQASPQEQSTRITTDISSRIRTIPFRCRRGKTLCVSRESRRFVTTESSRTIGGPQPCPILRGSILFMAGMVLARQRFQGCSGPWKSGLASWMAT